MGLSWIRLGCSHGNCWRTITRHRTKLDAIDADVEDEVNEAIRFALESPFPTPDMLYKDVYA